MYTKKEVDVRGFMEVEFKRGIEVPRRSSKNIVFYSGMKVIKCPLSYAFIAQTCSSRDVPASSRDVSVSCTSAIAELNNKLVSFCDENLSTIEFMIVLSYFPLNKASNNVSVLK